MPRYKTTGSSEGVAFPPPYYRGPRCILDIHCAPCERAGDPNPPRLARFARPAAGGRVEVQAFSFKGHEVIPRPHRRPDGGVTWRLGCPHGHYKPIREERIIAALDAIPLGQERARISL